MDDGSRTCRGRAAQPPGYILRRTPLDTGARRGRAAGPDRSPGPATRRHPGWRNEHDRASPGGRGGHRARRGALPRDPARLSRPDRPRARGGGASRQAGLRQPRPWLRGFRRGQGGAPRRADGDEYRHRHRLQRHALGPSALRALSGPDQAVRPGARRHRPGGGRHPGHVRRGHAGPARHGAVAVLPRHDRPLHRGGPESRHVRRRGAPRHLRQDRAGPTDRRAALRPPADDPDPGRADALRPRQQGEAADPAALRRGQGRPRGTPRIRVGLLSRRRDLHLLRHRQLEPDDDGHDGPAHAGRVLHQSRHQAAPGRDPRGDPPAHRDRRRGQRITARWGCASTRRRS